MTTSSGITAIVTAHQRVEQLLVTLSKLLECQPPPNEILVHVDGADRACEAAVRQKFPAIGILVSERQVGPGGGRNKLVAAAKHAIVASFDDDSFPIDSDYFARVAGVFARIPEASIVGGHVYHRHETIGADEETAAWVADFSGGACAYRREHFLATGGYVSLETAYGMEEVDLALRLHAQGRRILQTSWLRVFHDTDLARHADPTVTTASVANLALLTYLRYPRSMWPLGMAQIFKRIWWLLGHGRRRGVLRGLTIIRATLRKHRGSRRLVAATAVRSYLRLRRNPVPIELGRA